MPGTVIMTRKDGSTYPCTVKWTPDEVAQMSPPQLIQMLNELKAQANYYFTTFDSPLENMREQCSNLQLDKDQAKTGLIARIVVFAIFLILWVFFKIQHWDLLATFAIFPVIVAAVLTVVQIVKLAASNTKYRQQFPATSAAIQQLEQAENTFVTDTGHYMLSSGLAVLPKYFLDEAALQTMIEYIANQRARTLGDAVNLYEAECRMVQQTAIMQQQLAAQHRAANYAAQAAANSAAAAAAARQNARNTLYK